MTNPPTNKRVCDIDGCELTHVARGLCDKHYQAAWKAGTLPPKSKKPSDPHTCARGHKPGRTCYVGCKCRCQDCRDACSAYARKIERQKAYGTFVGYVDAEPVRHHVRALMASQIGSTRGMGWKRIAAEAGVPLGSMSKLLYGDAQRGMPPSRRISRANAEKLLGVEMLLADGATVQAAPVRRKIEALVAAGFTKAELGRYITGDVRTRTLQIATNSRYVTVANARKVDDLWRRWKAGQIVPRPWSRWQHGPPSPLPATPAPDIPKQVGVVRHDCEECGAPSLAGGRWCLTCFQTRTKRAA